MQLGEPSSCGYTHFRLSGYDPVSKEEDRNNVQVGSLDKEAGCGSQWNRPAPRSRQRANSLRRVVNLFYRKLEGKGNQKKF